MGKATAVTTLYSHEQIQERIVQLAQQIAQDYPDNPLIVAILKGSFMFVADLVRALHYEGMEPEMEFMHLSSYGANTTSGAVKVERDLESVLIGRKVIIVDDILESGKTISFARQRILEAGAKSVSMAILLDKSQPDAGIKPDYFGFRCPNKFVVGYGMDLAHKWRQLPFIGYLDS